MKRNINRIVRILLFMVLVAGMVFNFSVGVDEVSAATKKPSKVTISSIGSYDYNAVKITWKKAKYAKKYQVYRATSKNGKYKCVKTTTSRSYINKSLTTGKKYYYKVRAVNGSKKGSFSTKKYATPTLKKVSSVKAVKSSYNSIKVSWGKVSGATGYQVYRATSKSGKYSKVGSTKYTNLTNTKLTVGKTYYYKVRPYRVVSGSYKYGVYSSIVSAKTSLSTPSNISTTVSDKSVIVSWESVSGAKKYEVVRNDGKVFSTSETSYEDTTVKTGISYKYKVRAYNNVYSSYSSYTS